MAPPTKRLVITKDESMKTERIPVETKKKKNILKKTNKKSNVLKFLHKKAMRKSRKQKDRAKNLPLKHLKPTKHFFKFRRLETLVKNKTTKMKHWRQTTNRRDNKKNRKIFNSKNKRYSSYINYTYSYSKKSSTSNKSNIRRFTFNTSISCNINTYNRSINETIK